MLQVGRTDCAMLLQSEVTSESQRSHKRTDTNGTKLRTVSVGSTRLRAPANTTTDPLILVPFGTDTL